MKPRAHPYQSLPDSAFWRQSVAETPASDVDPVVATPFTLSRDDRVAAAGSCFAQHIGRYLSNAGLRYLVTEEAHPLADPATAHEFGYGVYTARFGNLYTARQLRQLLTRAYGTFRPRDDVWREADGTFVDPFRPRIQPKGFPTLAEYEADRAQHFACVRRALEELDVLVFTLGLTECWLSREDGAAYPLCPGVAGGTFDPTRHEFHNFTVDEIVADLTEFVADLRRVNPRARLILTVSPVPLIATASERHVLAASPPRPSAAPSRAPRTSRPTRSCRATTRAGATSPRTCARSPRTACSTSCPCSSATTPAPTSAGRARRRSRRAAATRRSRRWSAWSRCSARRKRSARTDGVERPAQSTTRNSLKPFTT
jgi:GSCFA family protein